MPDLGDSSHLINHFIEVLRIDRGASEKTIEAYRRDLELFRSRMKITSWNSVTHTEIQRYFSELMKEGLKATSISRKVSSLRQFFKFCCLEKGFKKNPAENLETPSLAKRLPKYLTPEQVTTLLDAVDKGIPYSTQEKVFAALQARDAAMVYLIYATGLRVTELVSLTVGQVDIQQGYLRVRGKGEKERITPFASIAGERLAAYLEKYRGLLISPKKPTQTVFLSHYGDPLTRKSFWETLKRLASQAGVTSKLSPHMLRHSFATHLLQSGMNLRSLQMLLGHSDLSTTQIYTHIAPEHLKSSHRKYHPRGE